MQEFGPNTCSRLHEPKGHLASRRCVLCRLIGRQPLRGRSVLRSRKRGDLCYDRSMSAESVMLTVLTPRSLRSAAESAPAKLRAQMRWHTARISEALKVLRGPVWSIEQLDLAVAEFMQIAAIMMKAVATDSSWLGPLGLATAEAMTAVRLTVRRQLGNSIPGVAADYAVRMFRSLVRSSNDAHELLEEYDGQSPDAEALLALCSHEERDFLRGQIATVALIEAAEAGPLGSAAQHLACIAAQRILRGLDSPAIASLVPSPFQGETTHLRGERLLRYARLASTASNKIEREVILRLRTVSFSDRSVEDIVLMYDDALRRLA